MRARARIDFSSVMWRWASCVPKSFRFESWPYNINALNALNVNLADTNRFILTPPLARVLLSTFNALNSLNVNLTKINRV